MNKAFQYITKVSQSSFDEFGNYLGENITDHQAYIAIELLELELLEAFSNNKIDVEKIDERIKELNKKLKNIII